MARNQIIQHDFSQPTAHWQQVTSLLDLSTRAESMAMLRRLRELASLPPNWDGYGSPPITTAAKEGAVRLLFVANPDYLPGARLDPVSGGGLQFEWRVGPRSLELEVLPDGNVEFLVAVGNEMAEGDLPPHAVAAVQNLLGWLMSC